MSRLGDHIEIGSFRALCLVLIYHYGPGVTLEQSLRIADDEEEVPGSSDRNIKTSHIGQETQASLDSLDGVSPDAIEDHDVFLATLEGVNGIDLNIAQLVASASKPGSECVFKTADVGLVRRDNSDFARQTLAERFPFPDCLEDELDEI